MKGEKSKGEKSKYIYISPSWTRLIRFSLRYLNIYRNFELFYHDDRAVLYIIGYVDIRQRLIHRILILDRIFKKINRIQIFLSFFRNQRTRYWHEREDTRGGRNEGSRVTRNIYYAISWKRISIYHTANRGKKKYIYMCISSKLTLYDHLESE